MAINLLQTLEVIEIVENFIQKNRPPEHLRRQVDLDYKIENFSVIIYELRSVWKDPEKMQECNIAKATFIKSRNVWKVFWFRADFKWHNYTPCPIVKTLQAFIKLVDKDTHACFWG